MWWSNHLPSKIHVSCSPGTGRLEISQRGVDSGEISSSYRNLICGPTHSRDFLDSSSSGTVERWLARDRWGWAQSPGLSIRLAVRGSHLHLVSGKRKDTRASGSEHSFNGNGNGGCLTDSLREGKFGIHIGIAWDAKGNLTAVDCQPTETDKAIQIF